MRNLKRALSLALAFVMVMSMMVVGAGAVSIDDFSDKDQIVNTEAVMTMVSLGVINGKDDGSYDPTGIVTRAEMAKLISVTLNGGKDPTLGAITANFTDTKGHWAESYIAYVASLGIVDGRGDGTFGPNDQVTGAQAAKMILTMLGYRSEIEGFTGANWALNVQLKGNDINLFDGLNINPDEGLTRDDTAQMLYNAVQAQEVEYRNLDGNYNDVIYPTEKGTMLANRFGVVKVEGLVVANDVFGVPGYAATSNGRVRLEDTNTYNTTGNNGQTVQKNYNGVYSVDIPNDMVGTRIVIYVQFKNALAPNATDSTVIGTPISSDKNTVAVTANRMKDIDAVRSFLSDNDLSLTNKRTQAASSSDDGYYVGTLTFTKNETVEGTSVERAFAATGSTKQQGIEFKFIDHDDDGVVDYIFRTEPTMAKVTVYDDTNKKMTIAGLGSTEFSDIANPEDVAKDDMVLYYLVNETYYLEKVETVSGEVTAYSDANKTLTLDGTAYAQSAIRAEISSTDLTNLAIATNEDGMDFVGNTYTFYLDSHGNVVAWVLGEASVGNYALVLGADVSGNNNFKSAKVKLLLADGTTGTYNVNLLASANRFELTGSNSDKENAMANKLDSNRMDNDIVVYTIGSDGTVTLGNPAPSTSKTYGAGDGQATNTVARGTGSYTLDIGNDSSAANDVTVKVNDSTLFFIRNQSKNSGTSDVYSVVQGVSNLPTSKIVKSDSKGDATVESAVWTLTDANYNVAKAVFVDGEFKGTANYVYVVDTYTGTKKTDSGELVYTYPVVFENGEKGELNFGTNTVPDGVVLEYTIGNNGVAEYVTDVAGDSDRTVNGVVSTYGNRNNLTVVYGDGHSTSDIKGSYTVATDAQIWNVESDPVSTTLTSDISVVFVLNSEGLVKTAFVKDTNVTSVNNANVEFTGTAANAGLSVKTAGTNVYSGYDLVIAGGANGKQITYMVTYDNNKQDAAKTATFNASSEATISVPKNAAKITVSAYSGSSTPSGDELDPTAVSATDVNNALKGDKSEVVINGNFDPALFADTGVLDIPAGKTLTIKGNFTGNANVIIRGTLNVEGTYKPAAAHSTFTGTVKAQALDLTNTAVTVNGTLDLGTGAITGANKLTVAASGTVKAGNVTDAVETSGTTTVGTVGGTLDVKAGTATTGDVTGNVTVAGGEATVADVLGSSTVTVSGGKLTLTKATTNGAISVSAGELIAPAVAGNLTMTSTGKATVATVAGTFTDAATTDVTFTSDQTVAIATINGKVTFEAAQTALDVTTIATGSNVTFNGDVTVAASALAANEDVTFNGNLTVSASNKITVADGKTATINGVVSDGAGIDGGSSSTAKIVFGEKGDVTTVSSKFKDKAGSSDISTGDFAGMTFTWDNSSTCWKSDK